MSDSADSSRVVRLRRIALLAGLDDETLRATAAIGELRRLAAEEVLFREGDYGESVYFILEGALRVETQSEGRSVVLARLEAAATVGEVGVRGPRSATVVADRDTELLEVHRTRFEDVVSRSPELQTRLAGMVRDRLRRSQLVAALSPLFGDLDEQTVREMEDVIDWVRLDAGQTLWERGATADAVYIVVDGRLRSTTMPGGEPSRMVAEIGVGETVGEVGALSGDPRGDTVQAIRDSELGRFSLPAFESILSGHPQVLASITRLLARRLSRHLGDGADAQPHLSIVVVPLDGDIDAESFCARLREALAHFGDALHLSHGQVDADLGIPGAAQLPFDDPYSIRLTSWLRTQEARHDFLVYQADAVPDPWTRRCVQNADRVVLLANAARPPSLRAIERELLEPLCATQGAARHLVLQHRHDATEPTGTRRWLEARRVDQHHHVRGLDGDFARLARIFSGRAIGLVLAGGGARGGAHIGVIRALEEAGIPIDVIGGTSSGGVVAALHAGGRSSYEITLAIEGSFGQLAPFKGYTLPLISLTGSRRMRETMRRLFEERRIEDLWLGFFCISCDLSSATTRVHREGALATALRASCSPPGISVPVVDRGSLLVDGALVDNMPIGVMRAEFGTRVIGVDVSADEILEVAEEIPSPWRMLWRLVTRSDAAGGPNIVELILRSLLVNSADHRRRVTQDANLMLRPTVSQFDVQDFHRVGEVAEVGYRYTREVLEAASAEPWLRELLVASGPGPSDA